MEVFLKKAIKNFNIFQVKRELDEILNEDEKKELTKVWNSDYISVLKKIEEIKNKYQNEDSRIFFENIEIVITNALIDNKEKLGNYKCDFLKKYLEKLLNSYVHLRKKIDEFLNFSIVFNNLLFSFNRRMESIYADALQLNSSITKECYRTIKENKELLRKEISNQKVIEFVSFQVATSLMNKRFQIKEKFYSFLSFFHNLMVDYGIKFFSIVEILFKTPYFFTTFSFEDYEKFNKSILTYRKELKNFLEGSSKLIKMSQRDEINKEILEEGRKTFSELGRNLFKMFLENNDLSKLFREMRRDLRIYTKKLNKTLDRLKDKESFYVKSKTNFPVSETSVITIDWFKVKNIPKNFDGIVSKDTFGNTWICSEKELVEKIEGILNCNIKTPNYIVKGLFYNNEPIVIFYGRINNAGNLNEVFKWENDKYIQKFSMKGEILSHAKERIRKMKSEIFDF